MILTSQAPEVQYYIHTPNGQEIGPYQSETQARMSLATLPIFEGGELAIIVPKAASGAQVLLG